MAEDIEHQEAQPQNAQAPEPEAQEPLAAGKQLASSLLHDEDSDNINVQHVRELFAVLNVDGKRFRRLIPMLLLVFVLMVLYVTNSYQAQQEILKEEELNDSLKDCKYRCLTREGELTRRTRQSQLERSLRERGDSTLVSSKEPPFLLTDE